jgi:hypothetical protein
MEQSSMDQNQNVDDEREITTQELRGWLEFGCWTTLALVPFLYWINGPAVSTDQLVVRTALVTIALLGAIGLRVYCWMGGH